MNLILFALAMTCLICASALAFSRLRIFERRILDALSLLHVPISLTSRQGFFPYFRRITEAMTRIELHPDPLLQDLASQRLTDICEEVERLAQGTVSFAGTETWRAAYQKLLLTLKVQSYYSVAWVRSADYWNDLPGRQSMQMNYDLVQRGFHIKRIHILPDTLWPFESPVPSAEILPWLQEQHGRGIAVHVVREADLAEEASLIRDFAIYGDRASATQELDDRSRTVRFELSFDRQRTCVALDHWDRLSLFATPWQEIVDQMDRLSIG